MGALLVDIWQSSREFHSLDDPLTQRQSQVDTSCRSTVASFSLQKFCMAAVHTTVRAAIWTSFLYPGALPFICLLGSSLRFRWTMQRQTQYLGNTREFYSFSGPVPNQKYRITVCDVTVVAFELCSWARGMSHMHSVISLSRAPEVEEIGDTSSPG